MTFKLSTVQAATIREGDEFLNADGEIVWHAVRDAYVARDRTGERVVAVDVQHHPDGGLETRLFTPEMEWSTRNVRRAPQGPQGVA